MKPFIIAVAVILICTGFFLFQVDHDSYMQWQAITKSAANDAADVASLFYDQNQFADGLKVYDKAEGEKAVLYIIRKNMKLSGSMMTDSRFLPEKVHYTSYYFDETGMMTTFEDGYQKSERSITFPFSFVEARTGYSEMINGATVIVTIDVGRADYKIAFIKDPKLIRTSGYEHQAY